jgi:hypothetical protein
VLKGESGSGPCGLGKRQYEIVGQETCPGGETLLEGGREKETGP